MNCYTLTQQTATRPDFRMRNFTDVNLIALRLEGYIEHYKRFEYVYRGDTSKVDAVISRLSRQLEEALIEDLNREPGSI